MWQPRQLPVDFRRTVESIFEPAAESAKPGFNEADLRSLHSLISLTVEFHIYLTATNILQPERNDVAYACESIFSGIESFVAVNNSYRILVGSITSELEWNLANLGSLKEQFISMYQEFLAESVFERKCRLLLDLFKLQIVFAGMSF